MADPKQPQRESSGPPTRYVVIAARSDQEGVPWNGYWWQGCHWPAGVHEVSVVSADAPQLLSERKAYSETDASALYSREEAEAHGDPDLVGKFRPWRFLTQKELDAVAHEPKHCIKVVDRTNDPRLMVFPVDTTNAPQKTPADKARERLAEARSAR